jgi:hypothetical protein
VVRTATVTGTQTSTELLNFFPGIVKRTPETRTGTSGDTNIVKRDSVTQKYFFSVPFGKWILYTNSQTEPKFTLLYNPVPRTYAADYLKENTYSNGRDELAAYCLEADILDPVCKCINIENDEEKDRYQFCMNDLVGGNKVRAALRKLDRIKYNTDERMCHCINSNCLTKHPVRDRMLERVACPSSYTFTSCNVNIQAGQSIYADNLDLQQKCAASVGLSPTPEQPSPPPTPERPSPPPPTPERPSPPPPTPERPSPPPPTPESGTGSSSTGTEKKKELEEETEETTTSSQTEEVVDSSKPSSPSPSSETFTSYFQAIIVILILGGGLYLIYKLRTRNRVQQMIYPSPPYGGGGMYSYPYNSGMSAYGGGMYRY